MLKLYQGDCLEVMKDIPDKSIDMILCDLPYEVTACKWDNIIPFEPLWEQYNRIIKDNGAICLFGTEPFSSRLRMSNIKYFRYDWIWEKSKSANFMNAKKMPLKKHEIISVFYKDFPTYNPQMKQIQPYKRYRKSHQPTFVKHGLDVSTIQQSTGQGYPTSILYFQCVGNSGTNEERKLNSVHPTQKPVPLLEYLIRTYTNEDETVLDNCMGSGSTGVACVNTGRNFIGIEIDENYYNIAENRINQAVKHDDSVSNTIQDKRIKLF